VAGVALVGSYELLMMIIRSSQVPADGMPETGHDADPLHERAAELFAGQLAADRVPSVRAIRAQLHVCQARRSGCETTSPQELQGGRKIPLREQLAGRRLGIDGPLQRASKPPLGALEIPHGQVRIRPQNRVLCAAAASGAFFPFRAAPMGTPGRPATADEVYYESCYAVVMSAVTVRVDEKTRKELDEVAAELGESASEVIRKAIHLAWFAAMQDRMRRESAEIAADPAEREEAERIREWARYLAS
jgi:predicted transcriptional regulator